MFKYGRSGFTLIEIMIVVAIIAIALSIAIPNFFRMSKISKATVCINNMKKIAAAIDQWAIDNNISSGTEITADDETAICQNYLRGPKPVCPSSGKYTLSPIGGNPQIRCSDEGEGHKL